MPSLPVDMKFVVQPPYVQIAGQVMDPAPTLSVNDMHGNVVVDMPYMVARLSLLTGSSELSNSSDYGRFRGPTDAAFSLGIARFDKLTMLKIGSELQFKVVNWPVI